MYVGETLGDPAEIHWRAAWSNNAILASGLGLRALSLVDLAVWDLSARLQKTSVTRLTGRRASGYARDRHYRLPPDDDR